MTDFARLTDLLLAVETGAAAFYDTLARRFADRADLRLLWTELAADEREHARWIREAREWMGGAALPTVLPRLPIAPLEAALQEIRQQRERFERGACTVVEALAATIALEMSEVTDVLSELLRATRTELGDETLGVEIGMHIRRLAEVVNRLNDPELSALLKSVMTRADRQIVHRRTIMVVDDEADMLETCARIFRRSGYTCLTAASGPDALALLGRVRPDLILADLRMPRMNGLTLLREAKQMAPEVPVVIFTGYVSEASARDALEAGAAGYLAKPFTATQLRLAVERALGGGR